MKNNVAFAVQGAVDNVDVFDQGLFFISWQIRVESFTRKYQRS